MEEERAFLRQNREKRKTGTEFNFSVIYKNELVGAVGKKIDQQHKYIRYIDYGESIRYPNRNIGEVDSINEEWAVPPKERLINARKRIEQELESKE
jgi:hypothetical protein